ncbi:MAG: hypothetical protein BWY02_02939 [bacterium ADurb.Bin157]|nr:MAG: hypothetical protein BWY02_02939 [bacterium ADurb.Bin157]
MWLVDHQMNMQVSEEFGLYFARIPLRSSGTIVCANALQIDWSDVVPMKHLSYIMGNPPFIGFTHLSSEQKLNMLKIFGNIKNAGVLDFVTAWYKKTAEYLKTFPKSEAAFVSTNSICQGESVAPLWNTLLKDLNMRINFAHQTFKWSNEAAGKAAVYCVIIGFSATDRKKKQLFLYDSVDSEPHEYIVAQINAYLVDAPNIIVESRKEPLCVVSNMVKGSIPVDGGNLIIEDKDYADFITKEPAAKPYIRYLLGAEEFINNKKRYCLWLENVQPNELKSLPMIMARIDAVKRFRLASSKEATRKYAAYPSRFMEIRQPKSDYILIPRHSSESRTYVPIGFVSKDVISSDANMIIPDASLYEFGVLTSLMHMSWMRHVCGRIKSDYRYSKDIVYNNFPWPAVTPKSKKAIESAAQAVLNVRNKFPRASLGELYSPLTMPADLVKAHHSLDKAVDSAYGKTTFKTESDRISFLFELYQQLCSLHAQSLKNRS